MDTEPLETSLDELQPPAPLPWGLWPTLGFSILVIAALFGFQILVAIGFVVVAIVRDLDVDPVEFLISLESNGTFFWVATLVSMPACAALVILFAGLRKGIGLRQYFSLNKISLRQFFSYLGVLLLFVVLWELTTILLSQEVDSQLMIDVYTTSSPVAMLWIAMVLAAPLFEEAFFRGFIFAGLQHSRVGPAGAVILTSLAWSGLHFQYTFYGMTTIFSLGLLLGFARLRCGSLYPCLAMHSLWNLISMIGAEVFIRMN